MREELIEEIKSEFYEKLSNKISELKELDIFNNAKEINTVLGDDSDTIPVIEALNKFVGEIKESKEYNKLSKKDKVDYIIDEFYRFETRYFFDIINDLECSIMYAISGEIHKELSEKYKMETSEVYNHGDHNTFDAIYQFVKNLDFDIYYDVDDVVDFVKSELDKTQSNEFVR